MSTQSLTTTEVIESVEIIGISTNIILSTACSAGKLIITEVLVPMGVGVSQTLRQHGDTVIYIAEGKFAIVAAEKQYVIEKGASIFIPRSALYSYNNVGTSTGKLLVTLTPGIQYTSLMDKNRSVKVFGRDASAMQQVARKYEVEML